MGNRSSAFSGTWGRVLAILVGLLLPLVPALAAAPASQASELSISRAGLRADPLLSVDMNRSEIVDRLMTQWQGEFAAGQRDGFKAKLAGLRADRLLAASLVGSFDGVLKVLYGQEQSNTALATLSALKGNVGAERRKALGDADRDLVYTPLSPCRLFDTRTGQPSALGQLGGTFAPDTGRNIVPAGACLIPGSAVKNLFVSLTTLNNTPGSGGYITLLAPSAPVTTTTDIFNLNSEWSAANSIVTTGTAGQFVVYVATANAHVVVDVLGYFAPPPQPIGDVTEINTGTATTTGLTGGVTSGVATLTLAPTFKLPQACANGQVPKFNTTSGLWECQNDNAGTGTVTSVATGAGLTGGPISTTGTINLAASQLLPTTACTTNQIAKWSGTAWVCNAPPPTLPTSCLDGQLLKLVSGAIQCSAAPQTFTTVDSVDSVGQHASIAQSRDGLPVISYFDLTNSSVKVIKCGNAACSGGNVVNTVDNSASLGRFTSIAVMADGFPIISYSSSNTASETTASSLKVAKCVDVSCTSAAVITVVDATAVAVGRHSSITIGADGFPVISYYDGTNGNLKVAKCTSNTCATFTITTLDGTAGNDVGQYTSIAVPVDGLPVISYFDATNFDLKVVKCSVANCSTFNTPVTVDGTGGSNVGQFTSIAIAADGFPVIAYFASGISDLKVAKCIDAGCTGATVVNTVDNLLVSTVPVSIRVSADGLPVISYGRVGNGLVVAKCGNATCASGNVISVVDTSNILGSALMVPVSDSLPVIAYGISATGDLRVVKCSNSGCVNP